MATDQQNLAEAKTALHKLLTGKLPNVVIDQNGEQIRYNYTNRRGLENYITELEARISPQTNRPMTVSF